MTDAEKIAAMQRELNEIEQVLGKALHYPPYPVFRGMDYSTNPATPTDAPDSDWVCVGDNTALSLADEAAAKLKALMEERENG